MLGRDEGLRQALGVVAAHRGEELLLREQALGGTHARRLEPTRMSLFVVRLAKRPRGAPDNVSNYVNVRDYLCPTHVCCSLP